MHHYLPNNIDAQRTFRAKLLVGVLDFVPDGPLSVCICGPTPDKNTKLTIVFRLDCVYYDYTAEAGNIFQALNGMMVSSNGTRLATVAEVLQAVRSGLAGPTDVLLSVKNFNCKYRVNHNTVRVFQPHPVLTVQLSTGESRLVFAGNGAPVLVGA